jgi:hypothetical protein
MNKAADERLVEFSCTRGPIPQGLAGRLGRDGSGTEGWRRRQMTISGEVERREVNRSAVSEGHQTGAGGACVRCNTSNADCCPIGFTWGNL